jgi:hypothetical protein
VATLLKKEGKRKELTITKRSAAPCHTYNNNNKFYENSFVSKQSIGKNSRAVKIQMQQVTEDCKGKFAAATLLKKKKGKTDLP